jgi:hypothetical protein
MAIPIAALTTNTAASAIDPGNIARIVAASVGDS